MSGDGNNSSDSGESPFSTRPSPRMGTRVRSRKKTYAVDLGFDKVPRRERGARSGARGDGGGEGDPIALDASGSINAGDEEDKESSALRSGDDEDMGGGKKTARGRPRASSKTAGGDG